MVGDEVDVTVLASLLEEGSKRLNKVLVVAIIGPDESFEASFCE